jgi:hypothetical protein
MHGGTALINFDKEELKKNRPSASKASEMVYEGITRVD